MSIVSKRLISYLIDIFIIFLVLIIIKGVLPVNIHEIELNNLNELYIENKIDFNLYFDQFISITHNIDKSNISFNLFGCLLIIIFCIVIPFLNKGQTLGQKICKLKISKKDLTIKDLS